jgi:hypothetical protein
MLAVQSFFVMRRGRQELLEDMGRREARVRLFQRRKLLKTWAPSALKATSHSKLWAIEACTWVPLRACHLAFLKDLTVVLA